MINHYYLLDCKLIAIQNSWSPSTTIKNSHLGFRAIISRGAPAIGNFDFSLRSIIKWDGSLVGQYIFDINYQLDCFDQGEPFAPVSLNCRFIMIHISCFEQRSCLHSFQLLWKL